jgi:hypothetical protein
MCEIYGRSAMIYAHDPSQGARCLRTFHEAAAAAIPSSMLHPDGRALATAASHRQPMRLSYYGGGHYDSIRVSGESVLAHRQRRSNQQEAEGGGEEGGGAAVDELQEPGRVEDEAIARAKRTVEALAAAERAGNMEAVTRASDREATDQAALELAIEVQQIATPHICHMLSLLAVFFVPCCPLACLLAPVRVSG